MAIVRANFNAYEAGEDYKGRLEAEANRNLQIFFALLSSYWTSTIDGPNYARELKTMSLALAQVKLALDDVRSDISYSKTRGEYLYQTLTTVLFPQHPGAPNIGVSDIEFRDFLVQIVEVYFQGSIPKSMLEAVQLIIDGDVRITENFLEARKGGSPYDISDEFGFLIDVILPSAGSADIMLADKNIRLLLNIIRPAHTLYRLRFILTESYIGNQTTSQPNKVVDSFSSVLSDYGYEDFKKFSEGVEKIDMFGMKKSVKIIDEDVSGQFLCRCAPPY